MSWVVCFLVGGICATVWIYAHPIAIRFKDRKQERVLVVETGSVFRLELWPHTVALGRTQWTVAVRNRLTYELILVGVPKDEAVFAAECLPPRVQSALGVEHGLERVVFMQATGFRKTDLPVNPAFRPFPDKIQFLQRNGLSRAKRPLEGPITRQI